MELRKIKITEEDRDIVQRAAVDMESRREILAFMIANKMSIEGEQFKAYEAEYKVAYFEFEKAKSMISDKYVIPTLKEDEEVSWNLDYNTCEITVTISK